MASVQLEGPAYPRLGPQGHQRLPHGSMGFCSSTLIFNSPALFKTARDADHPTLKSPSFAPLLYSSGSPPIPL